jgi:hypothetical protein
VSKAAQPPEGLARLAAAQPAPDDPRGAALCLRQVLEAKVRRMAAAGDVDREQADELAKIGQALARLEGAGFDLRAAAAEVLRRLAGFALEREADRDFLQRLAGLLDAFFLHLEGQP